MQLILGKKENEKLKNEKVNEREEETRKKIPCTQLEQLHNSHHMNSLNCSHPADGGVESNENEDKFKFYPSINPSGQSW